MLHRETQVSLDHMSQDGLIEHSNFFAIVVDKSVNFGQENCLEDAIINILLKCFVKEVSFHLKMIMVSSILMKM